MMLGIVLHSAQVFNPAQAWVIYSEENSVLAKYLVDAIHVFRMPAFFVISGFFCLFTVQRYSTQTLITTRLKRILIPFIVTAVTLNSIQALVLNETGWKSYTLYKYLTDGSWVTHLWFLVDLMVYFLLAYILLTLARKPVYIVGRVLSSLLLILPVALVLLALPFSNIAILALKKIGFPLYTQLYGVINMFSIIRNIPYFVFGALLFARPQLLARFAGLSPLVTGSMVLISLLALGWIQFSNPMLDSIHKAYFEGLLTWASISLCFFIFMKFFPGKSRLALYLSDASYSVYLFHHLLVIVFGLLLIRIDAAALPTMILLITLVSATAFGIHHWLIRPSSALRFLFNGK